VISGYLDQLAGALSFDRALSRCVRLEVEDHLCEAIAADPALDRHEAERRAIANFGDPHAIAAEFAMVSLTKQTRNVGVTVALGVAGVLVAMKARIAWYTFAQWALSDHLKAVGAVIVLVDRYAFLLSVPIAIAGFVWVHARRIPGLLEPSDSKQLSRLFFLCAAATGALVVSVISDGVLTALQLSGVEWGIASLVPILTMAIEIAWAGALVAQLRGIARRRSSTAALLKM
jgi:hypothetical protein